MRTINAKVGTRTGGETLVTMTFKIPFEAKMVKRVIDGVWDARGLDRRTYVVLGDCDVHGYELLLVLPAGSDHEAQLRAVADECRKRLDIEIQTRPMKHSDYPVHMAVARQVRADLN